jgi:cytochrome c peroxidase
MDVYFNKAKCDQCHEGVNFTANAYANLGIGTDKPEPDTGRYEVTKDPWIGENSRHPRFATFPKPA